MAHSYKDPGSLITTVIGTDGPDPKKRDADPETRGQRISVPPRARGEHLPRDGSRGQLSYAA